MIPKNIHEAAIQVKNDHIKRLENAIRVLVENFDADLLLSRIRQGTTAEELLEAERDHLRARVARLEELVQRLLDNNPNETIADNGATVLCAWRHDVSRALEEK